MSSHMVSLEVIDSCQLSDERNFRFPRARFARSGGKGEGEVRKIRKRDQKIFGIGEN